MDYSILGSNIREERINQNMTQKELASQAHVTPAYIGQIERGERNVSLDVLIQIANALNTSVDCLIEYTYNTTLKRKNIYRELYNLFKTHSNKELLLLLHVAKDVEAYLEKTG